MSHTPKRLRKECDRVALVLQGGGALGSYQAGVYEALHEEGYLPDWVAGISIGAINSAIIAGNPPEDRIERLHQFWTGITRLHGWSSDDRDEPHRRFLNMYSAAEAVLFGVDGFFRPRIENLFLAGLPNINPNTSYYDTSELGRTLSELIDFDLINAGNIRLSVGAVDVASGNFRYFDSRRQEIRVEHIMASGALPPGFPPVEVDGHLYWDGGLLSNTPLTVVLEDQPRVSTLAFQVDLFPAQGKNPTSMAEVDIRMKDIRYSSRTRYNTDTFRRIHRVRHKLRRLITKIPPELQNDPEVLEMKELGCATKMHIAHLIYQAKSQDMASKDYEFSRSTMEGRWQDGYQATTAGIATEEWKSRKSEDDGMAIFDLTKLVERQSAST